LENPGIDERIILKWYFKEEEAWTGSMSFKIGTVGGLL
jgi:hypothetical protein